MRWLIFLFFCYSLNAQQQHFNLDVKVNYTKDFYNSVLEPTESFEYDYNNGVELLASLSSQKVKGLYLDLGYTYIKTDIQVSRPGVIDVIDQQLIYGTVWYKLRRQETILEIGYTYDIYKEIQLGLSIGAQSTIGGIYNLEFHRSDTDKVDVQEKSSARKHQLYFGGLILYSISDRVNLVFSYKLYYGHFDDIIRNRRRLGLGFSYQIG